MNFKKTLIRKQKESIKKKKQNEGKRKRENIIDEDIDVGNFFEIALSDKNYVTGLILHKIKNDFLLDF